MKRVFYLMLFVTAVFLVGLFVMQNAMISRIENFYNGEALSKYEENKTEEYMDIKFLSLGSDSYLKYPLYSYQVSGDVSFDFNIYHYGVDTGDGYRYAVLFEVFDFETNNDNKTITILLEGEKNDQFYQQTVDLSQIAFNQNWFVPGFIDKDDLGLHFNFNNTKPALTNINKITIKQEDNNLLVINNNEDEVLTLNQTVTVESGNTSKFVGEISSYDNLKTLYDDESNVLNPNQTDLSKYNSVIVNSFTIFIVVVLTLTFYFFFRKPLIAYLERRKLKKRLMEKERG